jgi:hypothetical protein
MADDEHDHNLDFIPPKPVYGDDILVNDTGPDGLGRNVPFWKVLLWHTAKARSEMLRNDSVDPTPLRDEDQPPRLAADEKSARAQLSDEDLRKFEDAIDKLDQRLTMLEARKNAEEKLEELEDALEATGIAPDEDGKIKLQ